MNISRESRDLALTYPDDIRFGGVWSPSQRIRNHCIFYLVSSAIRIAICLPRSYRQRAAKMLGDLLWLLWSRGRKRTEANLQIVFALNAPHSKAVFHGLASLLCDAIALLDDGPARDGSLLLLREDRHVLEQALARGRGVVYATAHLGPWERMAAVLAAEGWPIATVARESYDPRFHNLYDRLRERRSVHALYRGAPGFARALVRALRAGSVVGFPMDLAGRGVRTVQAPWFGRMLATPIGPAAIALRTGAAVVVGTPAPYRSGQLRIRIDSIETAGVSTDHTGAEQLTHHLATHLSARIADLPTLWPWMHPELGNAAFARPLKYAGHRKGLTASDCPKGLRADRLCSALASAHPWAGPTVASARVFLIRFGLPS